MKDPNRFYVYAYCDPDKNEPFYIGKGNGRRAFRHTLPSILKKKGRFYNKLRGMVARGVEPKIEFLYVALSDEEALRLEVELIAKWGRLDLGTGCLCNHTSGGDGKAGHVHSEESLAKMRVAQAGRVPSPETLAKAHAASRGRKHTPEELTKMRDAAKRISPEARMRMGAHRRGRPLAAEHRAKVAAASRSRSVRVYSLNPITGETRVYDAIIDAAAEGFASGGVSRCCAGKKKTCGGLIWSYAPSPVSMVAEEAA